MPGETLSHMAAQLCHSNYYKRVATLYPFWGIDSANKCIQIKDLKGRSICTRYTSNEWMILFVLRFYGQSTKWGHVERGEFILPHFLLGRFSPLNGSPVVCTFFHQKLTTAFLESAEAREWMNDGYLSMCMLCASVVSCMTFVLSLFVPPQPASNSL